MGAASPPDDVVRLEDVPVRLFLESQNHQRDLILELQLIQIGDRFDLATTEVSHRLARLIAGILSRYQRGRSVTREQALAALDRGEELVTLEVPVRPGIAEAMREWLQLLEEGRKPVPVRRAPSPRGCPELRELRRWYVQCRPPLHRAPVTVTVTAARRAR